MLITLSKRPFTVILNILVLNKSMAIFEVIGCLTVFIGVIVAITYGTNKSDNHKWEKIDGSKILRYPPTKAVPAIASKQKIINNMK